jgi:vacuolar-type H+-ATPase subunit I/STV1
MKKIVNFCGNCPFLHTIYDFENYDKTIHDCSLLSFLQIEFEEQILDPYNEFDTLESCPLKDEEFSFKFNKFSDERLQEIDEVKTEAIELEIFFEKNDYDKTNEDQIKKNIKLTTLYERLNDLHTNEEKPSDFQQDLNENINKIKEQLELLSEVGNKFNQTINDLNKEE